ncbi:MAG: Asp-tRNA(Asn)/Glu-tRNA(Gln) amidotransferase GatCAB subunit C [Anaerolineae bacterium]|jgi:aspartyl-tRNA(Asn)/glutamyl-tRNA(Gln) amidotransferase subunit C|nr:MAG: Asp-tRNA(Asn)/Glu-tRNA(Gln) amidotransferase GatCAB subunit C [Anaerolineae bacterium]
MSLTREQVDHIARLARLNLSDEERERYREQLSAILDHFQRLQELDTEAVPPTFRAVESQRAPRPDQVQDSLPRAELLSNAPEVEQNQFRVPPILD